MNQYEIPLQLSAFAHYIHPVFVPRERRAGFQEGKADKRGNGDFCDLVGTLLCFHLLAECGAVCRLELTAGAGDDSDLAIRYRGEFVPINIKTSTYAPYGNKLHLFIKEEELHKKIDIYVQCFVHLDEGIEPPHVHVAGWLTKGGPQWNSRAKNLQEIPGTGGHRGMAVPITELRPFKSLLNIADKKF